MENMKNLLGEVNTSLEHLGKNHPDFMKAFAGFMGEAEKPGAIDKKTKELISIALSITSHCKWCIAFHVKGALDAGANKEEIMETCFVAALMGGGPAFMYTQLAVKALEDLSE